MKVRGWWLDAAIVLLALALRVAALDLKPVHFDEGVNGWFVDQMTKQGYYHYDPGNFHGPLHYYALFGSLRLFGRNVWALRLPLALVSTLAVAMMLAYRRYLPARACRLAALAMAISPGCVFYGRYAIHESWLLLFLLLAVWGLAGLWREGEPRQLWAAGLGLTGMVLIKETYAIHWIALALAAPTLLLCERFSASEPFGFSGRRWTNFEFDRVVIICTLLVFFFYTGGLLDGSSLPGLWQTFAKWSHTGTGGLSGHEKPPAYFFELIARYEWPALLGLAAIAGLALRGTNRLTRYLAIYGLGALTAYSLVAYKTPWCVIVLLWPFYFVFGLVAHRLMAALDRWTVGALTAVLCAFSFGETWRLNFREFANGDEPYVYVQTTSEIDRLLVPLRALVARDARNLHVAGHVLTAEHHPLLWLLGDFTRLEMLPPEGAPATWDAAFLLIDEGEQERVEGQLTQPYFRDSLRLRGDSSTAEMLYLHAATFTFFFPGRTPEFIPGARDLIELEPELILQE